MSARPEGRIGPNAITRVAAALTAGERARIFAGRDAAPAAMVPAADVARLHAALRRELGVTRARAVARAAGEATGAYLLAHRVPRAMRAVLPWLPSVLSLPVLRAAVRRHAWTFAGDGRFAWQGREITLERCPFCRDTRAAEPLCDYPAAVFESLLRDMVDPRVTVRQVGCAAMGDAACRFICD